MNGERDSCRSTAEEQEHDRERGHPHGPSVTSSASLRSVAAGGVEVVARRAPADRVAELVLDPERLAQVPLRLLGLPGAEMERPKLVVRPRLSGQVRGGLRRAQERPERADELEPTQAENRQAVDGAHDLELLPEPAAPVEASGEVEQRADLTGDQSRVEELATSGGPKDPVRLLDPARDLRRAGFERHDRGRAALHLVREPSPQLVGIRGLPLRLEMGERPANRPDLERVAADPNGCRCRRRVAAEHHSPSPYRVFLDATPLGEHGQATAERYSRRRFHPIPTPMQHAAAASPFYGADSATPEREALLEAGRLGSLGELVRGLAHEINNPLFGMLGLVDVLLADLEPGSPEHDRLLLVRQSG